MTEDQAARCSYREYEIRLRGRERALHREWERTRWEVWQMLSPNYKKGQAPKTPQAFCRFPWEEPDADDIEEAYRDTRVSPELAANLNRLFTDRTNTEE